MVDQLVGTSEIAARLGMKHSHTVHEWRKRYSDFPVPVASVSGVLVWNWPDVERWARRTGRNKPR